MVFKQFIYNIYIKYIQPMWHYPKTLEAKLRPITLDNEMKQQTHRHDDLGQVN